MYLGALINDGNTALQDRVQRHYGRIINASDLPATTDNTDQSASGAAQQNAAGKSWQDCLTDAMARTTPIAEMQAAIKVREAELAERERALANREQALKARISDFEFPYASVRR